MTTVALCQCRPTQNSGATTKNLHFKHLQTTSITFSPRRTKSCDNQPTPPTHPATSSEAPLETHPRSPQRTPAESAEEHSDRSLQRRRKAFEGSPEAHQAPGTVAGQHQEAGHQVGHPGGNLVLNLMVINPFGSHPLVSLMTIDEY